MIILININIFIFDKYLGGFLLLMESSVYDLQVIWFSFSMLWSTFLSHVYVYGNIISNQFKIYYTYNNKIK